MITQELQNKTILALDATTRVNSVSKKSRFTNQKFNLGSIVYEREDVVFFENISFENCEWRPLFRFETGKIELDNMTKKNACTITINNFKLI